MNLFSEMDLKLENTTNPAEFAALAYSKHQLSEITDLAKKQLDELWDEKCKMGISFTVKTKQRKK